ncbi:MAG: hypothetical protein WC378_02100, partial [Opitutaceae bacterium]
FGIGDWVDGTSGNPLIPVFNDLFANYSTQRTIDCAILYGYELAGSDELPIVTYLPARFRPKFQYDPNATLAQILDAIAQWKAVVKPSSKGGEWVFGISLFSSVDGQLDRPLLELKRLCSKIIVPKHD